jgi:cell wall-associated NlpC family hydrolase
MAFYLNSDHIINPGRRDMIPPWVSAYVGIPYDACDCWHLLTRIYRERWGIELPDWTVDRQGLAVETILTDGPAWVEVAPEAARLGDLVAITRGGLVYHVGLVVAPGWMLHTLEGMDSVVERFDGFVYRARLSGLWRHPAFTGAGAAVPG